MNHYRKMNRLVVDKFLEKHRLSKTEYIELLKCREDPKTVERLCEEAVNLRKQYYGNKVFTRGLIEFTNYCKNNCNYCGIRGQNGNVNRYRLTGDEILACCQNGYQLGYRTFVLQGGEDPYYTDERMVEIIHAIKKEFPDCALTLSIGEKSYESYRLLKNAGADRYLLRHETADESLYQSLHPNTMSLKARKQCLFDLKELGYQVGAGFMVGSPGQKISHIAAVLLDPGIVQSVLFTQCIPLFHGHIDVVFAHHVLNRITGHDARKQEIQGDRHQENNGIL